jgi:hypothetical protein
LYDFSSDSGSSFSFPNCSKVSFGENWESRYALLIVVRKVRGSVSAAHIMAASLWMTSFSYVFWAAMVLSDYLS